MIAQLHVLLPYLFVLPEGMTLEPIEFESRGLRVRVHAPAQPERISATAARQEQSRELKPASAPTPAENIQLDGGNAVITILLIVDVHRENLDRRMGQPSEPPIEVLESIVNDVLSRIRSISNASWIEPVALTEAIARVQYLDDDESPMTVDKDLVRTVLVARREAELQRQHAGRPPPC